MLDFSTVKLFFFIFSILSSLEGGHYMLPTLSEELFSLSFRAECLNQLFGILHGRFICSSPFIYSIICLY